MPPRWRRTCRARAVLPARAFACWWRQRWASCSSSSSLRFTLYALITGFHAAHVVFGVALLTLVATRPKPQHVEPSIAFWHMVDLVWVLVFPVLYLVPR